jgi:hypothetical protein
MIEHPDFIYNRYHTIYFKIVNRALDEERSKSDPVYYERHHVEPTSIFGRNDKTVLLSAKEHFVCHWLLTKFTTGRSQSKMFYALKCMATKGSFGRSWSSLEYRIAKEALHKAERSPETAAAISAAKKGKAFTDAHRQALSEAQRGKKQSEDQRKKRSETLKAKYAAGTYSGNRGKKNAFKDPEARGRKISESLKARSALMGGPKVKVTKGIKSLETRARMAEARKLYWEKKKAIA